MGFNSKQVPFDRVLTDSGKILKYITKKFKSPGRAYLAMKFVIIYIEETMGLGLPEEEEMALRAMIREESIDL